MNQMAVISKVQARELGLKTFFTGVPCIRGHIDSRGTASGACMQCNRDKSNEFRQKNPELDRAKCRAWYAKNKDHAAKWKREWISANQETYKKRRLAYRGDLKNRAREMLASARYAAKLKGIPFDLDRPWILEKLSTGVCELTGLQFRLEPFPKGRQNPYTASLDRIDPELGYVKSNVRVILWALNAAFNSYGENVYAEIARVYLSRHSTGLT